MISIILPTYNGEKYIDKAIKSVISQTYTDWELIIIDDGSSDGTDLVIKNYLNDKRIIYIKKDQNTGITDSLNIGLKISKGEYIARIDDDDEWIDKDKIEKQIEFLKNNKEYVLVGTSAVISDENGLIIGKYNMPESDKKIRERIMFKNCFLHSSIMGKKEYIFKAGCYSNTFNCAEDYDLWLKIGLMGKLKNLKDACVKLTIHPNSITYKNRIKQAVNLLLIIKIFKNKYPNYRLAYAISYLRLIFFKILKYIPIKNRVIYKIQSLYKSI